MTYYIILFLFLSGCSYSINMVHTEGQASDVVDEMQTDDPNTNLDLPLLHG